MFPDQHHQYCNGHMTVTSLNTVMSDVNKAPTNFDANHRIIGVGYWVRAIVGVPPFGLFYVLSRGGLSERRCNLGC